MAARLAMRRYDCRNRTPCFLASRVSPLIAAWKSFASVREGMFFGCTVGSTLTRAKSFVPARHKADDTLAGPGRYKPSHPPHGMALCTIPGTAFLWAVAQLISRRRTTRNARFMGFWSPAQTQRYSRRQRPFLEME